jgi:hypothetical protein
VPTPAKFRLSSLVILPALTLTLTATALAQTNAPAKSAATTPAIPLTPFTASDQSATAGVPAGWKVTQSGNTEISMTGPQGETVVLGFTIVAHNSAFQPGQKALAPAAVSMPYSATLSQKLAMLNQQGAALQGHSNPQVVIASATPVQVPQVLGQCGKFVFNFTGKTAQGQIAPLKAMAFYCSLPVDAAGFYKNILIQAQAPVATAAQSAPTALAIFGSYKIPPAWLQKLIAPVLNPQDQAAIAGQARQASGNSGMSAAQANYAASVINGETNRAIQSANQSFNCADANIRGTPTILLPQSCGGPWPEGMAPQ